jgi:hypothetical protein
MFAGFPFNVQQHNNVGFSSWGGPTCQAYPLLYHWWGPESPPGHNSLVYCGLAFNSFIRESTINTSQIFDQVESWLQLFKGGAFVYFKILVLIMGPIAYEAHIEWMCETYSETTPLQNNVTQFSTPCASFRCTIQRVNMPWYIIKPMRLVLFPNT